mmetsp:Transcript_28987/g.77455  ORF Transcript_28987/g.77455 Transcript_28987/m.77455 type:complete len:84 (+) Transcript_28987:239-490(+)
MLNRRLTMNGLLSAQLAELPPSHADFTLGSNNFSPVWVSHESTGLLTCPLPAQEQLGLQQSQYPVVHVPLIHSFEVVRLDTGE